MKETGRKSLVLRRRLASIFILLAISAAIALPGTYPRTVGLTWANQDPAPPPSPPYVSPNPDNLDFGNQVVRRTSAAKRITVKNTGGQPLNVDSVELDGDNPDAFAVVKDTCTGKSF